MRKQELMEYRLQVENEYDILVRIQEDRDISYGEIAYVESLKKKQLEEFEKELFNEFDRIINILEENGLIEVNNE